MTLLARTRDELEYCRSVGITEHKGPPGDLRENGGGLGNTTQELLATICVKTLKNDCQSRYCDKIMRAALLHRAQLCEK